MKSVTPLDHNNIEGSKSIGLGKSILPGTSKRKTNGATITQLAVSPGQKLKQAREKQSIQLADIANKLHLSERYIKAIEEDDLGSLPGITFVRGYVRLYAREVKLPESDLISAFEEMVLAAGNIEIVDSLSLLKKTPQWRDSPISWVSYLVVAIVLALTVTWWWNTEIIDSEINGADQVSIEGFDGKLVTEKLSEEELTVVTEKDKAPIDASSDEFGSTDAMPVSSTIESQLKSKIKTSIVLNLRKEAERTTVDDSTGQFKDNQVAGGQNDGESNSDENQLVTDVSGVKPEEDTIFMSFTGECWVRVGDANDKTIHVSLRGDGEVLRLKGVAPFHVKLGDAKVVAVKFNERTISVPEPTGQSNVVKFVINSESA